MLLPAAFPGAGLISPPPAQVEHVASVRGSRAGTHLCDERLEEGLPGHGLSPYAIATSHRRCQRKVPQAPGADKQSPFKDVKILFMAGMQGMPAGDVHGAQRPMKRVAGCSSGSFRAWIIAAASYPSTNR